MIFWTDVKQSDLSAFPKQTEWLDCLKFLVSITDMRVTALIIKYVFWTEAKCVNRGQFHLWLLRHVDKVKKYSGDPQLLEENTLYSHNGVLYSFTF